MTKHSDHANARGVSYIEMLVVMTIIGIFSMLVFESLRTYSGSQGFYRAQARARSIADRIMEAMVHDGNRAIRVFRNDVAGNEFIERLDFGSTTPMPGARLPVPGNHGYLTRDEEALPETGNIALFACADGPLSAQINGKRVRFDRLSFIAYYLRRDEDGFLDVVRWESEPVARYQELIALEDDTARSLAAAEMKAVGITHAWDSSDNPTTPFWLIGKGGALTANPETFELPANSPRVSTGMAADSAYQIAPNAAEIPVDVPFFARLDEDFPHGFEIKLDGDGSGRLLALRLVLQSRRNNSYAEAGQLIMVREE